MPFYPDLNACGISYMHFSFHAGGGLKEVDDFWAKRGLDRSRERLLIGSYSRRGKSHTVWLQWARSHVDCCDIYFGLEARRPSSVWPGRPLSVYRLREQDLRAFLDAVRKLVKLGITARYAFPWDKSLDPMIALPPRVRAVRLSLDVFDEKKKRVMNVTYEKKNDAWLAIVKPAGHFDFPDPPVANVFFKVPYDTACLLASSLRQERLEPL